MLPNPLVRSTFVLFLFVCMPQGATADPDPALGELATSILRRHCSKCHGIEFKVEGYNVLNRASLLSPREDERSYVVPGKPDESEMWVRFDEMPPKGPKPSAEEKAVIRRWIVEGAPFPLAVAARTFVADRDVLAAIRDHLRALDPADRAFQRYFTLTNMYNNAGMSDADLKLTRAGVSKMVNSLSRKPAILVPTAIGPSQTVLAVDIRRLGWDNARVWSRILGEYPYGLQFRNHGDSAVRELAEQVQGLVGSDVDLPDIRADWFLDAAARPKLYHAILNIPKTAAELERSLRVDVAADFKSDSLRRAGFSDSGVSKQMRMVDRHDSELGYYWKSYDFRRSDEAVDIFKSPLGPVFAENPFPDHAFTHAGGEIIFSLPNRLQAYMLIDRNGNRIDEGPSDIVFDANDSAGGSTIINALSCMGCHKDGLRPIRDRVRDGHALSDTARRKVERLFPEQAAMSVIIRRDEDQFLRALDEAIGPFLKTGPDKGKPTRDLHEPIVPIAKLFQANLDLATVAAELNLKDGESLRALIAANPRFSQLGLGNLRAEGGRVNRAEWGAVGRGTSTYQKLSAELGRGTPAITLGKED